jgi:putative acetyltransferase
MPIEIRRARADEARPIGILFRDSVRTISRRDYSQAQVEAWAPETVDIAHWAKRIQELYLIVAVVEGEIAGFAGLLGADDLDLLYVGKDHQKQGVASALLRDIEREARSRGARRLATEASLTARPFMQRRGFRVVAQQEVPYNGLRFINFVMEKALLEVAIGGS